MDDGYIKIWAEADAGDLRLFVQDNGRGMEKPQDGPLGFGVSGRPGEHLGMFNVDSILRLHFGDAYGLSVRSRPGEGCLVMVRLPDEEGEGMIRVLMVDDEPLVRRGIVAGVDWAALGCEVVGEARAGKKGSSWREGLPELIHHRHPHAEDGRHHDDEPAARGRDARRTASC